MYSISLSLYVYIYIYIYIYVIDAVIVNHARVSNNGARLSCSQYSLELLYHTHWPHCRGHPLKAAGVASAQGGFAPLASALSCPCSLSFANPTILPLTGKYNHVVCPSAVSAPSGLQG